MPSRLSIRKRLLVILISAIVLCWSVAVWFVYLAAHREVEEIYDGVLAQQARVLGTLMHDEIREEKSTREDLRKLVDDLGEETIRNSPLLTKLVQEYLGKNGYNRTFLTLLPRASVPGHRYESKIAFIVFDGKGRVMMNSNMDIALEDFTQGFGQRPMGGKVWRTFGLRDPDTHLSVQVGEQLAVRQETVEYIVLNSLWPLLVALVLFAVVIWLTVGSGLKPLKQVAGKVERRDSNSLVPISRTGVPQEVVPMVDSLNRLFERVRCALENERRFTADAAHELRTPLAALKTLAQAKQLSDHEQEHSRFFEQIIKGVDRTTHMLEQLLTLARMDSQSMASMTLKRVDLAEQVVEVLSMIGQQALEKDIELVCESCDRQHFIAGHAPAIEILIRNLLDNAIRYTPDRGSVRIQIIRHEDWVSLVFEDSGPGIPESEMASMFQRFHRGSGSQTAGSGLGLSIVQRIVELHHGTIELRNREEGSGLRVSVLFREPSD